MRIAGFSIFKFLRYLREELTIVLATASSDGVLPQIMAQAGAAWASAIRPSAW